MLPILYSFRRCPYAIRARLALHISGLTHELREVDLGNPPDCMMSALPKGSVPVLVLPDGQVIDESWDIMLWALQQYDPENWLGSQQWHLHKATPLIAMNDGQFKAALDRYKYANRFPEHAQSYYLRQCEAFLQQLELRLESRSCLLGSALSVADAAVFPFIRQCAAVDPQGFGRLPYPHLQRWLDRLLQSSLFSAVMQKPAVWKKEDARLVINDLAA